MAKRKFKYRPYQDTVLYPRVAPQNIRTISLPNRQVQRYQMSDGTEQRRLSGVVQNIELELFYPQADAIVLEVLMRFYEEVGGGQPFRFQFQTLYRNRNPLLEPLIKNILGVSVFRFKTPPRVEVKGVDRYDITINVIGWVYEPWKLGANIDTTGTELEPYSPRLQPRRYSGFDIIKSEVDSPLIFEDAPYPAKWVWGGVNGEWSFNVALNVSEPTSYLVRFGAIEWLTVEIAGVDYSVFGSSSTVAAEFNGYTNIKFRYYHTDTPVSDPALYFLITPANSPISDSYTVFPNLTPSFIQDIRLSDFGVVDTADDRLTDQKRIKSYTPSNTGLSLVFNALTPEDLETITTFYKECQGSTKPFLLPATVFSRYIELFDLLDMLSEYSLWVFNRPPSIKTEITGLYSTTIQIRAVKEYDHRIRKPYHPSRVPRGGS